MIIAFIFNIVISYLITYKFAKILINILFKNQYAIMQDNIALIASICLFKGLNYRGQRFIVFPKKSVYEGE